MKKQVVGNSTLAATALITATLWIGQGITAAVSFQGLGNLGKLPRDRFDRSPYWKAGYAYTAAAAVSADGHTVVGTALEVQGDDAVARGFVWTKQSGMRRLGLPDGYATSQATDVSGDGSVIVGHCKESRFVGVQQACRWTGPGQVEVLGDLGTRVHVSRAYGVSADGNVVVGESLLEPTGVHAFRWEQRTGMVDLGDLPGRHEQSAGYGVSADGSVVVGYGVSSSLEAFRWDNVSGLMGLGVLPGGRGWSSAHDVSADGSLVVGSSSPSEDPWESEACCWTADLGLQRLGDLSGGRVESRALAVSANGQVVVGSGTTENSQEAVLWDGARNIYSISEILSSAGIQVNGWTFYEATDVSADGLVMVGNGINPEGNREGWIASLRDEEPPQIVRASAGTTVLWPPNQKMNRIQLEALVTDDSGAALWGVVGIECNEPGARDDMHILDDHSVNLRASRSGRGEGRIYTIWLQAVDTVGNLSELFPVDVTVPHDPSHAGTRGALPSFSN